MELIHGTHEAFMFAPKDFISSMPDNVITNILDQLPLHIAVRTDILSKNWRHRWSMLSQLVLDESFFKCIREKGNNNNQVRAIISSLLVQLRGTITKCVIFIDHDFHFLLDAEYFTYLISFLKINGMTDLTLVKSTGTPLMLPANLFSCLGLKHLKLSNCCFRPPTSFNGFPNLLSVDLSNVEFETNQFGELITKCPVLEILKVGEPGKINPFDLRITMKVDHIAKLVNLKTLSMCVRDLENYAITSFTTIFEILGCLPRLQELHLDCLWCKVTEAGAIERFPTAFSCLKALELSQIDLSNVIILSCVFYMIRYFPNLQTLNIKAHNWIADPIPIPEVEYSTTGLRHVVFTDFLGSENEVCLLKYILACSPFLRKIVMRPLWRVTPGEQLMFTKKLLKLRRASTAAEIDFN